MVTGIGAVSPNGIGREAFWEATRNGVSGVRRITRFDPSGYAVQVAGEVVDFDEGAYVVPKERQHVSRVVPLGLAAVREALEDAGVEYGSMTRDELRQVGVIVGSGGGSQEFTEEQYRLYYTGQQKQCSVYTIPTSTIGTLASEVSMRFGFRGMSHIVSTGCTSSTDAIGYALRNIQAGVLDVMVAGGVDCAHRAADPARLHADAHHEHGLERRAGARFAPVLARSRRLRDGRGRLVLRAGGAGARAARGAHIYGEICGYGSTCEAYHRVRLEECGEEPARTMQLAMEEAGVPPEAVQYINYHGTSTELNDRIETRAIKLAFNGHAYKLAGSSREEPDRPSAGRVRRGRHRRHAAGHARRRGRRPPSTSTSPIRNAISITFPTSAARSTSNTPWRTASRSAARTQPCCCGEFS